eukprot:TRINITY_DN26391_c0_g1_i1.p1 TRINITY_DN26391_c0_g1~~TRINITY_DN26391_c0_g1_i1.p1  ORF type:complete len:551 (+),score=154.16 TRINITY_DN26391_c0_g1_i1:83-1735(+)
MDPYKTLGISKNEVKAPSDLDKVRTRAKKLYRRYAEEKNKFQCKLVMQAFEMIKANQKKIGEGAYKLLGRGRKERELDRHFNHQTKEIKKDRRVKRTLKQARKGEKRLHLPGDKEKIPLYRKSRRRRKRQQLYKPKNTNVDVLQGLDRLAAVLPQRTKFPKVIKLLHRWIKEYMNVDNREYIFRVLNDLTKLPFLAEDNEGRQDVIVAFEYILAYNSQWFDQDERTQMLGRAWKMNTILQCRCHTDDAFTLNSTITKLNEAFDLIEKFKPSLDAYLEEQAKREATKREFKIEAMKAEAKLEAKEEVKMEDECKERDTKIAKLAAPVEPSSLATEVKTEMKEEPNDEEEGDEGEEEEDGEDDEPLSDEELKKEKKPKAVCVDLDSDAEDGGVKEEIALSSEEELESADEIESSSEAEELASAVFPVPSMEESLIELRAGFVDRCLFALFRNRGPLWARSKVDNFFQDIFYRKECLSRDQQTQVEAWQARIKVLQKEGEHKVGDANSNPLESHRPVVDSRETRTVFDADSSAWSAKQTFDAREVHGGRQVIR